MIKLWQKPACWIAYRLDALSSSPPFVALAKWGTNPADGHHDDDVDEGLDDGLAKWGTNPADNHHDDADEGLDDGLDVKLMTDFIVMMTVIML